MCDRERVICCNKSMWERKPTIPSTFTSSGPSPLFKCQTYKTNNNFHHRYQIQIQNPPTNRTLKNCIQWIMKSFLITSNPCVRLRCILTHTNKNQGNNCRSKESLNHVSIVVPISCRCFDEMGVICTLDVLC